MNKIEFTRKENDKIIKYELSFDSEKLKKLRNEIKNKIILTEHRSYTTEHLTKKDTYLNFKSKVISEYEDREYPETHCIYEVEYDEIVYTSKLVYLIDDLIENNDSLIIDYLEGDKHLNDLSKIKEQIKDLHNKLTKLIDSKKYIESKKVLDKLISLSDLKKFYEEECNYLFLIKDLMEIEEIDSIDNSIYEHVLTFKKNK